MNWKPPYPKKIIPQCDYHKIIVNTKLHGHFLIRYDTKDNPIPDHATYDSIKKENFSTSNFKGGWSTSLLGVFSKKHARFVIRKESKKKFIGIWEPGDKVKKVKERDFEYKINRGYFGLLVKDILSCSVNMDVTIESKVDRTDKVYYEILHEPTHCNFWHFAIYAYAINSKTNEKYYLKDDLPSKNAATNATRNIAEKLKTYARLSDDIKQKNIPLKLYCRKKRKRF